MKKFFSDYFFDENGWPWLDVLWFGIWTGWIAFICADSSFHFFQLKDFCGFIVLMLMWLFEYLPPMILYKKHHPNIARVLKHCVYISIILYLSLIVFF